MADERVDLPEAQKLDNLLKQWLGTADTSGREAAWLHNVPEQGIYSWDPGAHFGIYKPDCFWVDSGAATTN